MKNAHDADARNVTVHFSEGASGKGDIVVVDDGFGMDRDTLLGSWMEPAGSTKVGAARRVTPKGRRMLGEKGLGRFSADKLGGHLELISRRKGGAELHAVFDWDLFDSDTQMLGEIHNRWEIRPPREIATHGTILRITKLRMVWTERMFRRLCTRLARLRSPLRDGGDFAIHIESDAFPEYSGELVSDFLEKSPYRMDARFDGRDSVHVKFNGKTAVEHAWSGSGPLSCGPVRIQLQAFDLETEAVARLGPRMEVRAWLKEWSGVSVYRDGFRVWPYGEPHDDWLRLDQRRVNNPVVRLSNNQVVGFVELTQEANSELRDQTNREGMVANQALDDLRRLLGFGFQLLESERQSIRHPTAETTSKRTDQGKKVVPLRRESSWEGLVRIAAKLGRDDATEVRRIAAELRAEGSEQARQHRHLIEGYSDLAAVGQAALSFSGESTRMLAHIREAAARLRKSGTGDGEVVRGLEAAVAMLDSRMSLLASMETGAVRRRRTVDVQTELETYREMVTPLLQERGVKMDFKMPRAGLLRAEMSPESFRRVVHIMVSNSLEWLHAGVRGEIRIEASPKNELCEIAVTDNGRGFGAEFVERIFEPTFSLREDGRGMGLTIARNIVNLSGGSLEAVVDRRRRGAAFLLTLPRKKSRST